MITNEAVERGIDVAAVVRGDNKTNAEKVITKDLFDLTKEDLKSLPLILHRRIGLNVLLQSGQI